MTKTTKELPVEVPWQQIETTTLKRMLEEFISREGTDYGQTEYSLEDKIARLMKQLEKGKAAIVFESESETFTLISKDRMG